MKKIHLLLVLVCALKFSSCSDYLDIVPDNIPTLDHAFNMRSTAERYLFTCYSYMPATGSLRNNIAQAAGDEYWFPSRMNDIAGWNIAKSLQRVNNPYMNCWQGNEGAKDLYEGIRQCNLFIEGVARVPDMTQTEKDRWVSEAKFLKAYFHFYLLRTFGPIPLVKENVPVNAEYGDVYPTRNTIDECFEYIVQLIDEAIPALPEVIENEVDELGRITQEIALSQKAIVLVEAASDLYNGNSDFKGFRNNQGQELFNQVKSHDKWVQAAVACSEAIAACHANGHALYTFVPPASFTFHLSDTIKTQMSIRNVMCAKWNAEIIWANTNSRATNLQAFATPRGLDPAYVSNNALEGYMAPPIKIAEMFYSENGLPIEDDKNYNYSNRWGISVGAEDSKLYIKEGYLTANLHFHREPRFYANLGFDGGIWYGQGKTDDSNPDALLYVSAKKGNPCQAQNELRYSVTGYWPKKLVNYLNIIGADNKYTREDYPWVEIRLANLYLLYAEALNEANQGPGNDPVNEGQSLYWIDMVRARAGLKPVVETWTNYAKTGYIEDYEFFKKIVRRERANELVFEGQRYWDLHRWKEATTEFNKPISGWDLEQEDAQSYYRQKIIFNQQFTSRDYFCPIPETELLSNKNLNQLPNW